MKKPIYIVLCLLSVAGMAQENGDTLKTSGQVVSGEFVIEKDKEIRLPKMDKVIEQTPVSSLDQDPIDIQFSTRAPDLSWPAYKTDVPYHEPEEAYPDALYQNFIRLGYGNFNSPLLEAGIFNTFGKFQSRALLFYESFQSGPVNEKNSGSSVGSVRLSGVYTGDQVTISPRVSFLNTRHTFFGNTDRINTGFSQEDDLDFYYSVLDVQTEVAGSKSGWYYTITPAIQYASQKTEANEELNIETTGRLSTELGLDIDERFSASLLLDAHTARFTTGEQAYNRSLLSIRPNIRFREDALEVNGGFVVASGTVDSQSLSGFYPWVDVGYQFLPKWKATAQLQGDQDWISFDEIISENAFMDDSLFLSLQETTFSLGAGLEGYPAENVLLGLSLNYAQVNGLPFYTPSSGDSSRYILSYDSDAVGVFSFLSELSFMPNATSAYEVSLTWNSFRTEALDKPWHQPTFIFKAHTTHNIKEKILLTTHVTAIGGLQAPAQVDFGSEELPAFVDMGVGVQYLISRRVSAFVDVSNLFNDEYERYIGYPTRGISFKIGAQCRF